MEWSELAGELVKRSWLQVLVASYGLYPEVDVNLWAPVGRSLANARAVHGGPNALRAEEVVGGVLYVILDTVAGPREVDTTLGKGVREFVGDE